MLRFVREEWGLAKEDVVFETDEHPLCDGQRTKMTPCSFLPHVTSVIRKIYVSVKPTTPEEGKGYLTVIFVRWVY